MAMMEMPAAAGERWTFLVSGESFTVVSVSAQQKLGYKMFQFRLKLGWRNSQRKIAVGCRERSEAYTVVCSRCLMLQRGLQTE